MSATENAAPIRCDLCAAEVESVTAAIEAGWSASYFIGDDDTGRPVCGKCAVEKCEVDASDGELVLHGGSRVDRLAAVVGQLESAAESLRGIGGEDCQAAARVLGEMLGGVNAGGLRQLLAIWRERGSRQ